MVWAVLCSVLAVGVLTYVLLVLFSGRNTEKGTRIDDFIIEGEEVQHWEHSSTSYCPNTAVTATVPVQVMIYLLCQCLSAARQARAQGS